MSSNCLVSCDDRHSTSSYSSSAATTLPSSSSASKTSTSNSTVMHENSSIASNNRLLLSRFNDFMKCSLCSGYIIDATAINECLHSFCRSCIVKYFNDNHDCPKCGLKLSETRKWETLRTDSILQDLIYKLVPGLFKSQSKLQKEFNRQSKDSNCDSHDEHKNKVYYQLDDKISVLLMYSKYSADVKSRKSSLNNKKMIGCNKTTFNLNDEHRYLLCPAGFPIGSLKKFICLKYELSSFYKVDIMFDDKILDDDLQLLDIVYIYSTQLPIPLHFKLNSIAVHKNDQTLTTKSQINASKKSVNNDSLPSHTTTSLVSSSCSTLSSSKKSSSTSSASTETQSSSHSHMKSTTTTTNTSIETATANATTSASNTANNGSAKNDSKVTKTLKSVATQSASVISSSNNSVSSSPSTSSTTTTSTSTSTSKNNSNSTSMPTTHVISQNNQQQKVKSSSQNDQRASINSLTKPVNQSMRKTNVNIKPKVMNNKMTPVSNQTNQLMRLPTTSITSCSTTVTAVTVSLPSINSKVSTNTQTSSHPYVNSVKSVPQHDNLKNNIGNVNNKNQHLTKKSTSVSCSQSSTPKVTITATNSSSSSSSSSVSSSPSVSITATTMVTTNASNGMKNNFISNHLKQMKHSSESDKRKECDSKVDKSESEVPRKQMKVSQVNDKINSMHISNQNDSSKTPSASTNLKLSAQNYNKINNINISATYSDNNKNQPNKQESSNTSHSIGTSVSPNNISSTTITNRSESGDSNVSSSKCQNSASNQSSTSDKSNGEANKSNDINVDDKVPNSSKTSTIKAPLVSSSQSTVTSKSGSSFSPSSSPRLIITASPSPSTSSSSPKLSSATVTSSKSSTISSSSSSSSPCTSTPTSTKAVSSSFHPSTTSNSTSTPISRLINNQQQKVKQSGQGDKRQRESPSSSSPVNASDNRPSKMMKISKNQTLNSHHKNLQIQHQKQQQQQQLQQHQIQLHEQMLKNHDKLTHDSVFNYKALMADEKEAALIKDSPQTGFTLRSNPVDLRNPRNINHSSSFQPFNHLTNSSPVMVPIASGSSGIASGVYHDSPIPHMRFLEYQKLVSQALLMQHLQQANSGSFGLNLNANFNGNLNGNLNGNGSINLNGKSMNNSGGEQVKGFYKETLCNSPNSENSTKNDKNS